MEVTAEQVKELRDLTGAGMMDCKKALIKSEGNIGIAKNILRLNGIVILNKKQGGLVNTNSYGKSCFTEVIDGKIVTTERLTYTGCDTIVTVKARDFG